MTILIANIKPPAYTRMIQDVEGRKDTTRHATGGSGALQAAAWPSEKTKSSLESRLFAWNFAQMNGSSMANQGFIDGNIRVHN